MLCAALFVEFALSAVMSPGLVPLPLDMLSLDIGAPGVRRTLGKKKERSRGYFYLGGPVFFLFTVWLQRAFRSRRAAVVRAERRMNGEESVRIGEGAGFGVFLLSRSCPSGVSMRLHHLRLERIPCDHEPVTPHWVTANFSAPHQQLADSKNALVCSTVDPATAHPHPEMQ